MPSPLPVIISGSAAPALPSGVAKTRRWPRSLSARQGTPVSVGSKSLLGNGISTVAMAALSHAGRACQSARGERDFGPSAPRRPAMSYQTIDVRKLTPTIGAEIFGVDLSRELGNRQFQEIHDALM